MKCPRCGGRVLQLEREDLKCVSCGRTPTPAAEHREPQYVTGDPADKAGRQRRAQFRYAARRAGG